MHSYTFNNTTNPKGIKFIFYSNFQENWIIFFLIKLVSQRMVIALTWTWSFVFVREFIQEENRLNTGFIRAVVSGLAYQLKFLKITPAWRTVNSHVTSKGSFVYILLKIGWTPKVVAWMLSCSAVNDYNECSLFQWSMLINLVLFNLFQVCKTDIRYRGRRIE